MQKRKAITFLEVLLIIIFGFSTYANSINNKFVWDDYGLIINNQYIRSWSNLWRVFMESFGTGGGVLSGFYRPLQVVVHMADYSLFGFNPAGYHLTNILLHIGVALAIYWFVYTLFYSRSLAFVTSILFVAHPVHTEAVCYISGSSDSLSLLFILLSLAFYAKSSYSNNIKPYILSLIFFILALFSKENALILPLLAMLFHYIFNKKIEMRRFLPLLLILSGYMLFRFFVSGNFTFPDTGLQPALKRIPGFFAAITGYLRLLIFPAGLHLDYGEKIFNFIDPRAIFGIAAVLSLTLFALFKRQKNPLVSFSVFWFLLMLIPVSNIYPVSGPFMMEHWLYAPSLGFFLILASLICYAGKNSFAILFSRLFLLVILVSCFFLTARQNTYWQDPVTLYKRAIRYNPQSWIFYNELGIEYANAGNYNEAVSCYRNALQINPELIGTYNNLAKVYKAAGRNAEAMAAYKKIKEIASALIKNYYERGNEYKEEGRYGKAIVFYKKALELDPGNFFLYDELAGTYVIMGKGEKAIPLFKKAIEINPDSGVLHNNLAVAYYYTKQYAQAVKHVDMALKLGYRVPEKLQGAVNKYRQKK